MTKLIDAASRYIGVRYQHQGRTLHGLDCVGLVIKSLQDIGYLPDYFNVEGYGRIPDPRMFIGYMRDNLAEMSTDKIDEGVIVAMRFARDPQHTGIVGYDNTLIHAYEGAGKVVEHRLDAHWLRRITHVFNLRVK